MASEPGGRQAGTQRSLQMQSHEPVAARAGAAKTAIIRPCRRAQHQDHGVGGAREVRRLVEHARGDGLRGVGGAAGHALGGGDPLGAGVVGDGVDEVGPPCAGTA